MPLMINPTSVLLIIFIDKLHIGVYLSIKILVATELLSCIVNGVSTIINGPAVR